MDVRQIKQHAQQLPRIDKLLNEFEQSWIHQLNKGSYAHVLDKMPHQQRIEFHSQLKLLKKAVRDISFGQTVNEKLASLAHHVVDLKIASALQDHKKAHQVVQSLLRDPHSSLRQLTIEVPHVESQISLLCTSYEHMLEELCRHTSFESSVELLEGKHTLAIGDLRKVPAQQKTCLTQIGRQFVEAARKVSHQSNLYKVQ